VVGALANIAGITSPVPFLETTLELWNKVMTVNATGTYLVTKAFLPGMLENKWGRIVNMSSVSAQRGGGVFGKVPYSSAKAAILGISGAFPDGRCRRPAPPVQFKPPLRAESTSS
jgi:2-hydroxycyclohexanecarboxyl-CoA dehydrogenase